MSTYKSQRISFHGIVSANVYQVHSFLLLFVEEFLS